VDQAQPSLGPVKVKEWLKEGRFPENVGEVILEKHYAKFQQAVLGGKPRACLRQRGDSCPGRSASCEPFCWLDGIFPGAIPYGRRFGELLYGQADRWDEACPDSA
jgi:hypothetical protein